MKKLLISSLILVLVVLLGTGIFVNSQLGSVQSESEVVEFFANKSSFNETLDELENQGIIKSSFASKLLAKVTGNQTVFQGRYQIDKSWSSIQILKHLGDINNVVKEQEMTLTFIEGQWAKDFAKTIEHNTRYSYQEIIDYWNNEEVLKKLIDQYEFITDEILHPDTFVKLEGYFHPNTYRFFVDASLEDITKKLLDPMEEFYLKHKNEIADNKLSFYEMLTLASIIQLEAHKYEDQRLVASVFLNRLDIDMKLESSITLCYAKYEHVSIDLCETNPQFQSPYNTYVVAGLPIGPVGMVSFQSLEALLNPAQSDYLFFISEIYGDGTLHFAKTYEEHEANVSEYLTK